MQVTFLIDNTWTLAINKAVEENQNTISNPAIEHIHHEQTKDIFSKKHLKNVLRRLVREVKETIIKQTIEGVSFQIKGDKFQQLMGEAIMGSTDTNLIKYDEDDAVNEIDLSISEDLAQSMEHKWFNRMN